jgi:hypothetical protein
LLAFAQCAFCAQCQWCSLSAPCCKLNYEKKFALCAQLR